MKSLFLVLLVAIFSAQASAKVVINEIFADNNQHVYDTATGKFPDYIELYNTSSEMLDISGYGLSDDPTEPRQWTIPQGTFIAGNSFVLIWTDGEDTGLHTNFKLDKDGETVLLVDTQNQLQSSIAFGLQMMNKSYGCQPDGSGRWFVFEEPTPNKTNKAPAIKAIPEMPYANLHSGFYHSSQQLQIISPGGEEIRYTTDGSDPSSSSSLFTAPLNLSKTTIIRAAAFDGKYASQILTISLFINEREFDLPVVSITSDPDNFFSDEKGIYVVGTNGVTGRCMDDYPVNWNQDWQRPILFEYFSTDGTLQVQAPAHTRIMGGCSRTLPQKSLTIVSDNGWFQYPFFKDREAKSYKSIVLRNSGNDWGSVATYQKESDTIAGTLLRDAYVHKLVAGQMDIDYQAYQPVVVFLNGKYWGILNMREHLNENYIKNNHPEVDEDNVDLIKNFNDIKEGDAVAMGQLETFLNKNSFADSASYAQLNKLVDVNEFMNYQLTQIFISNDDWPGNNIRFWRERNDAGKWRFILFDTDFGLGIWGRSPFENNLEKALEPFGANYPNPPHATLLFRKCMENDDFRNSFIQRMMAHMDITFSAERMNAILQGTKENVRTEMPYQLRRWYTTNNTIEDWDENTNQMLAWGTERRAAMEDMLQEYFSLGNTVELRVKEKFGQTVNISIAGTQLLNSSDTLTLFAGIPFNCQAQPQDGYLFSHWEDADGKILSTKLIFKAIADSINVIVAVATERPNVDGLAINEILTNNKALVINDDASSPDYIELYNSSDHSINVSGLYISDNLFNPEKFQLPHSSQLQIEAGGFLLLWADGHPEDGARHLGFKLDKDGGDVLLTSKKAGELNLLSHFQYTEQDKNTSFGLYPDGSTSPEAMYPTPGSENTLLASVARLRQLSVGDFPLHPKFHPDSLSYQIAVPAGFESTLVCTATAYSGASISIDSTDTEYRIKLVSQNGMASSEYTVGITVFEQQSTFLADASAGSAAIFPAFDKYTHLYTIETESADVPDITWQLEDENATAEYFPAANASDTARIIVSAPHAQTIEYLFSYSSQTPPTTGWTYNMDSRPYKWHASSASHSDLFKESAAYVTVNKAREWDNIYFEFPDGPIDLTDHPYFEIGISSNVDCKLRVDLVDINNVSTNGGAITHEIDAGKTNSYIYKYNYSFWQVYPDYQIVDSSQIGAVWMCFNPGSTGLEAEVSIDYIKIGSHVITANQEEFSADIVLSDGILHPKFDRNTFKYTITDFSELPKLYTINKTETYITETTAFDAETGTAQLFVSHETAGTTTYNFQLRPEGLESNSSLNDLWVENAEIAPVFNPSIMQYTTVEPNKDFYKVFAETQSPNAELTIVQAPSIYQDSYLIVTAEDGSQSIYTVSYALPDLPVPTETSIDIANQTNAIYLYPNPATDYIMIAGTNNANIELYSADGKLVFTAYNQTPDSRIYLPDLTAGTYFAKLSDGQTIKIVSINIK